MVNEAPLASQALLSPGDRWEQGIPHDRRSVEIYRAIAEIDFNEAGDSFGFKSGGDGDNGETLMYLLDCYFARRPDETRANDGYGSQMDRDSEAARIELAGLIPIPYEPEEHEWPCENPADRACLQKAYMLLLGIRHRRHTPTTRGRWMDDGDATEQIGAPDPLPVLARTTSEDRSVFRDPPLCVDGGKVHDLRGTPSCARCGYMPRLAPKTGEDRGSR